MPHYHNSVFIAKTDEPIPGYVDPITQENIYSINPLYDVHMAKPGHMIDIAGNEVNISEYQATAKHRGSKTLQDNLQACLHIDQDDKDCTSHRTASESLQAEAAIMDMPSSPTIYTPLPNAPCQWHPGGQQVHWPCLNIRVSYTPSLHIGRDCIFTSGGLYLPFFDKQGHNIQTSLALVTHKTTVALDRMNIRIAKALIRKLWDFGSPQESDKLEAAAATCYTLFNDILTTAVQGQHHAVRFESSQECMMAESDIQYPKAKLNVQQCIGALQKAFSIPSTILYIMQNFAYGTEAQIKLFAEQEAAGKIKTYRFQDVYRASGKYDIDAKVDTRNLQISYFATIDIQESKKNSIHNIISGGMREIHNSVFNKQQTPDCKIQTIMRLDGIRNAEFMNELQDIYTKYFKPAVDKKAESTKVELNVLYHILASIIKTELIQTSHGVEAYCLLDARFEFKLTDPITEFLLGVAIPIINSDVPYGQNQQNIQNALDEVTATIKKGIQRAKSSSADQATRSTHSLFY